MDIQAVIFDFDGTLADTRKLIVTAKQEMMKELGLKVLDEKTCASSIGLTAYDAFSRDYPELSSEEVEVLVKTYRAKFEELKTSMPPDLFPGVDKVFSELKKRGIALAIATSRNRKSLLEFVGNWGMTDDFSVILCAEDTDKVKPEPEPVLKTLEALSIAHDQALVVGDMPVDILMGKRAGAFACGVTYGNSNREELLASGADFVIDSMEELLRYI
ncbi:MAG: HAD family hydrolase [Clostridiales bacterium]|nr:HAD family hydrolase [Clostridiales bacterium]